MARPLKRFVCQSCGAVTTKWNGRCESCGEWNTITEEAGATDTRREELRAIERKIANLVIVSPPEFDGDPQGVELVGELVALLRTAGLAPQTESKGAENDHVLGLFAKAVKEGPGASLSPCFLAYSPV